MNKDKIIENMAEAIHHAHERTEYDDKLSERTGVYRQDITNQAIAALHALIDELPDVKRFKFDADSILYGYDKYKELKEMRDEGD